MKRLARYVPAEFYPSHYVPTSRQEWITVGVILLGYLTLCVLNAAVAQW